MFTGTAAAGNKKVYLLLKMFTFFLLGLWCEDDAYGVLTTVPRTKEYEDRVCASIGDRFFVD